MPGNNQNNILDKPYVQWLEDTLRELVDFPVKGICFNAVGESGEIYTTYYNVGMTDKLAIAGVVQQDAMINTLVANGFIKSNDDGEEDE